MTEPTLSQQILTSGLSGMAEVLAELTEAVAPLCRDRLYSTNERELRSRVDAILSRQPEPTNPEPQPEQREIVVGSVWRRKSNGGLVCVMEVHGDLICHSGRGANLRKSKFLARYTWLRDPEPQPGVAPECTCDPEDVGPMACSPDCPRRVWKEAQPQVRDPEPQQVAATKPELSAEERGRAICEDLCQMMWLYRGYKIGYSREIFGVMRRAMDAFRPDISAALDEGLDYEAIHYRFFDDIAEGAPAAVHEPQQAAEEAQLCPGCGKPFYLAGS